MGFVGNLSLFAAVKNVTNRLRIDKVIAMVRLAYFLTHNVVVCSSSSNSNNTSSSNSHLLSSLIFCSNRIM